jgi:hypothetical protein
MFIKLNRKYASFFKNFLLVSTDPTRKVTSCLYKTGDGNFLTTDGHRIQQLFLKEYKAPSRGKRKYDYSNIENFLLNEQSDQGCYEALIKIKEGAYFFNVSGTLLELSDDEVMSEEEIFGWFNTMNSVLSQNYFRKITQKEFILKDFETKDYNIEKDTLIDKSGKLAVAFTFNPSLMQPITKFSSLNHAVMCKVGNYFELLTENNEAEFRCFIMPVYSTGMCGFKLKDAMPKIYNENIITNEPISFKKRASF